MKIVVQSWRTNFNFSAKLAKPEWCNHFINLLLFCCCKHICWHCYIWKNRHIGTILHQRWLIFYVQFPPSPILSSPRANFKKRFTASGSTYCDSIFAASTYMFVIKRINYVLSIENVSYVISVLLYCEIFRVNLQSRFSP